MASREDGKMADIPAALHKKEQAIAKMLQVYGLFWLVPFGASGGFNHNKAQLVNVRGDGGFCAGLTMCEKDRERKSGCLYPAENVFPFGPCLMKL